VLPAAWHGGARASRRGWLERDSTGHSRIDETSFKIDILRPRTLHPEHETAFLKYLDES